MLVNFNNNMDLSFSVNGRGRVLTGMRRYGTSFSYCFQASPYLRRHRSTSLMVR